MGINRADLVNPGAGEPQQHMVHLQKHFSHYVIIILNQKIINVADCSCGRIFDGQNRIIRTVFVYLLHSFLPGGNMVNPGVFSKILKSRAMTVGSFCPLINHPGIFPVQLFHTFKSGRRDPALFPK